MLVAPSDRPDLLTARAAGDLQAPGIRADLFQAFTRIKGDERPWYDPEPDRIWWLAEGVSPPAQWIPIPKPTLEGALAVRRSFLDSVEASARGQLEAALKSEDPLALFTSAIRSNRLQMQWHHFRTKKLVEEIRRWADESHLPWRENWITSGLAEAREETTAFSAKLSAFLSREKSAHSSSTVDQAAWQKELTDFAERLDEADLARIVVPLDIVMKMLRRR